VGHATLILSLQTTTFGAFGGIPTYNRLVCRVLNDFDKGLVLIATDKPSDLTTTAAELPNLTFEAFAHNRTALMRRVLRLCLTQKFDVVLIGHVNHAPLGWLIKKLQPQLRYGVILYGIEAWHQLSPLRRGALRRADFLISISDYTRQKASRINDLESHRIYLLPNAIDLSQRETTCGPEQVETIRGTRLLSVCRLDRNERYKGVDKVIEALPEVISRVPDVQYVVVGDGTDLERHKRLAQDLGVADRVHFPGILSKGALALHYQQCDVFVLPSAGEGFGFVFLEAMQYGKPIVAANSGGAPEVVFDDVTGRLVEYDDRPQLVNALTDLCLQPDKRDRMGKAGYELLQGSFTFPGFRKKLSEILLREMPGSAANDADLTPVSANGKR
jgi:glycosyltransferase involved in cell wall biosynthesis